MFIAFLIGLLMGVFFFGGLYWTVQRLGSVKNPAIFMTLSVIIRMVVLILGFYLLADEGYQNILLGLGGVILVRLIMVFTVKNPQRILKERK